MKKLPKKPSALIRLALDDLAKVERSKKYVVNMNTWHELRYDRTCSVCLAGAVMAKTLGRSPSDKYIGPGLFSDSVQKSLQALNSFRAGHISDGLRTLNLLSTGEKHGVIYRDIPTYKTDKKAFKLAMRKLARDLEKVGL